MPTWQLQGRCQAYLVVPAALPVNEQRAGVLAAIQQLHDHLPPDSRLSFNCPRSLITYVYETIATLAPTLPNITLLAPSMYGNEEAALVPWACRQAPAVPHVAFRVTRSYADQPWPWRSLCVGANPLQTPWLTDILKLPDPTTGQYDIDIGGFRVDKVRTVLVRLLRRTKALCGLHAKAFGVCLQLSFGRFARCVALCCAYVCRSLCCFVLRVGDTCTDAAATGAG